MSDLQDSNARLLLSCQKLWERESLLDCTIACPDGKFKAHKIILSASSEFLFSLLEDNPGDHPVLILDTSLDALSHLLNYLYYGNLPSEDCLDFFTLADKLQLSGIDGWSAAASAFAASGSSSTVLVSSISGDPMAPADTSAEPLPEHSISAAAIADNPLSAPQHAVRAGTMSGETASTDVIASHTISVEAIPAVAIPCDPLPEDSAASQSMVAAVLPAAVLPSVSIRSVPLSQSAAASAALPAGTPRKRGRPRKSRQLVRREEPAVPTADGPAPTAPAAALVVAHADPAGELVTSPQRQGPSGQERPARASTLTMAGIPAALFGTGRDGGAAIVAAAPPVWRPLPSDPAEPDWAEEKADLGDAEWLPVKADRPGGRSRSQSTVSAEELGLDLAATSREPPERRPTRCTSSSVQCPFCGKMCCNKQTLKIHVRIHTDERPFSCPALGCEKSFRQRAHLLAHLRTHDSNRELSCQHCGRTFKFVNNLQRHVRLHESGRAWTPRRHKDDKKALLCTLCGKKFASPNAFENHARVHTNQRPFVCQVCQKGFKQKSHLTEHQRIHSGQKPFQCQRCQLTFYNRTRFKLHQVQHINEMLANGETAELGAAADKFPSCSVCDKRFINASNLRVHERRHSNVKPHQCPHCPCRFKLAKTLAKHLVTHAEQQRPPSPQPQPQQTAQEPDRLSPAAPEPPGEAVIILREEEDGSLIYVPTLQPAGAGGATVQVILDDRERKHVEHLISTDGIDTKWLEAQEQQLLAPEEEPTPEGAAPRANHDVLLLAESPAADQ